MYKQMLKAALAAVAVLGTTQVAKADLTLNGNTGMFLNPDAYLVSRDHPVAQINYFQLGNGVETYSASGVMRAEDRLEIGGGIAKFKYNDYYDEGDTDFILNAKYQLRAPIAGSVAVAGGVGYNGALLDNKYAYLVASQRFGKIVDKGPITASVGVRWDNFSEYGENSSKASIYGGVVVPVSDKVSLVGELQSKNVEDDYYAQSPYAIGLRYRANDQFSVGAGLTRQGLGDGGSNLFVQVAYSFGR